MEVGEPGEDLSENEFDAEDLTGFDWNETLEDNHRLFELEEDNSDVKGQGQHGGGGSAASESVSLQGDTVFVKEEV